jgi:hypothetical protein
MFLYFWRLHTSGMYFKNTLKFTTVFIYIADYGSVNHRFSTMEHR